MIYFANLPTTTIADIIPVLVAGFDSDFVKPCMPKIAQDGTLYYDEHEPYVINASYPFHPLRFRSINWKKKEKIFEKLSRDNTFIGSHINHDAFIKQFDVINIAVNYNSSYFPLLEKSVEMFNNHHDKNYNICDIHNIENFHNPKSKYSIDLLDIFSKSKLENFTKSLNIELNREKINFIDEWLCKLESNSKFMQILHNLSHYNRGVPERSNGAHC